jgi:hypothetical protein
MFAPEQMATPRIGFSFRFLGLDGFCGGDGLLSSLDRIPGVAERREQPGYHLRRLATLRSAQDG